MDQLIKLLPEGVSVVAVIMVVSLFLKQQRYQNKQSEKVADTYTTHLDQVTSDFRGQLDKMMTEIAKMDKERYDQIQLVFNGYMNLSREMIQTMAEFRGALKSLENQRVQG